MMEVGGDVTEREQSYVVHDDAVGDLAHDRERWPHTLEAQETCNACAASDRYSLICGDNFEPGVGRTYAEFVEFEHRPYHRLTAHVDRERDSQSNARLFEFDRQFGVDLVAGADEAGRAALAGPLVAAAVLFDYRTIGPPEQQRLAELNDSKKISPATRERVLPHVLDLAAATATVIVPPDEIDEVGLHRSNLNALVRALSGLQLPGGASLPEDTALLVDGFAVEGDQYRPVIHGDSHSAAIAAASIIAKTTRDRIMREYAATYPAYGFEHHVGYITTAHSAAVIEHGPSPIHRLSYKARCYQQPAAPTNQVHHTELRLFS
jgi:ribonuclease HII